MTEITEIYAWVGEEIEDGKLDIVRVRMKTLNSEGEFGVVPMPLCFVNRKHGEAAERFARQIPGYRNVKLVRFTATEVLREL